MPKIRYEEKSFKDKTLLTIQHANNIIGEYSAQGYDLTLRQLYYQFVARGLLENKQTEYKRLGTIISDARRAGLVDWNAIVDRTRNLRGHSHWESPSSIIDAVADQFRYDLWEDQPRRLELWVEKEALAGVFARVCGELDIPYFSCKGYGSDSELWSAGRRLRGYVRGGQTPTILHFGDHDPSGIDMTRDIRDRLELFAEGRVEVRRLALNRDQIDQYNPPPNPAKETDARFASYQAAHGDESWELDALDPTVLGDLVRTEVESLRDNVIYAAAEARQEKAREELSNIAQRYDSVVEWVNSEIDADNAMEDE